MSIKRSKRLDSFFYNPDGSLAVTKSGYSHAELDNEPSIASPWLYDFAGASWKTQEIVRAAMKQIWINAPNGISGNDDLGEMSSWYVWAALGMYPLYPGRADLVLGSPMFEEAIVDRANGRVTIHAKGAAMDYCAYITALSVDGAPATRALASRIVCHEGRNARCLTRESARPELGRGPARCTAVVRADVTGVSCRRAAQNAGAA